METIQLVTLAKFAYLIIEIYLCVYASICNAFMYFAPG